MKVSVIIPCFNAADKIGRCLASLRDIDMPHQDYEVIFIDDCSTDGTFELLEQECAKAPNWHNDRLPVNSGSPSRPRNRGLSLAKGEYVFFLDCDDEILPETLRLHYELAQKKKSDMVRGYLLADDGKKRIIANRLVEWRDSLTPKERAELIIKKQSLTKTCLIRSSLLKQRKITYPENMKMGEDVVFVANAMLAASSIDYIDHPTYIYNKQSYFALSVTQSFGAKELKDHLIMWPTLQKTLSGLGVDYNKSRLHVSLKYVLSLIIQKNRGDIKESLFNEFSSFIFDIWPIISKLDFQDRHKEILSALYIGNFEEFNRICRPRLLISGYDLKFIIPALPELDAYFDVKIDEWPDHNKHDEKKSRELLDWAELIWCEWLLGNAVWYAANKKPQQRLIIRMHRFELSRDFGEKLKVENVDAVTAVSVHFFERLLERFPNIPRTKARLLPNFVRIDDYDRHNFDEQRLFTLAMIGILPARKRLDRALNILIKLRKEDPRYRLEVFGKMPQELRWIATDKKEMAYFEECRKIIVENNLEEAITFHGHTDVKKALAKNHVGFVLSTSEAMRELPGFESFHLAIADAFAGGGIGLIQHWLGAEFVWPEEFILPTEEAIAERILSFRHEPEEFQQTSKRGRFFIEEHYGVKKFATSVKEIFMQMA